MACGTAGAVWWRGNAALAAGLCAALLWSHGVARAAGSETLPGGEDGGFLALLTVLAAALLVEAWLNRKHRAACRELGRWARRDPSWEPRRLEEYVRKTFSWVQDARRRQDLATLRVLLHRDLYRKWGAEIAQMRSDGVSEVVKGPRLLRVRIVGARDCCDDGRDSFTALVTFWGARYRVDSRGVVVDRHPRPSEDVTRPDVHEQYWTYQRDGDRWLLRDVAGADGVLSLLMGMDASVVSEEDGRPS